MYSTFPERDQDQTQEAEKGTRLLQIQKDHHQAAQDCHREEDPHRENHQGEGHHQALPYPVPF